MTTLKNIINLTLTTVALAPLAPVIGLMWAARGLHEWKQMKTASVRKSIATPSWDMDTIIYCPAP